MTQTNGLTTLAELFADRVIVVPPFQTAYVWDTVPHLRDYIEDLKSQPGVHTVRTYQCGEFISNEPAQVTF